MQVGPRDRVDDELRVARGVVAVQRAVDEAVAQQALERLDEVEAGSLAAPLAGSLGPRWVGRHEERGQHGPMAFDHVAQQTERSFEALRGAAGRGEGGP